MSVKKNSREDRGKISLFSQRDGIRFRFSINGILSIVSTAHGRLNDFSEAFVMETVMDLLTKIHSMDDCVIEQRDEKIWVVNFIHHRCYSVIDWHNRERAESFARQILLCTWREA